LLLLLKYVLQVNIAELYVVPNFLHGFFKGLHIPLQDFKGA